jgi:hypothetical protein
MTKAAARSILVAQTDAPGDLQPGVDILNHTCYPDFAIGIYHQTNLFQGAQMASATSKRAGNRSLLPSPVNRLVAGVPLYIQIAEGLLNWIDRSPRPATACLPSAI